MTEEDRGMVAILGVMLTFFLLTLALIAFTEVARTRACYRALVAGADVVCEAAK